MNSTSPAFGLIRIGALIGLGGFLVSMGAALIPTLLWLPPDRPGCDTPIRYRVEDFDPRFPLDATTFRRSALEAEAVWERGTGKDLFMYDPQASLAVRTEFDERQKMTDEAKNLEEKVSAYEAEAERLDRDHEAATARYGKESATFKATADAFNRKLAEYNDDIREWNASGSGTTKEYEALERRRKKLEKEEADLVTASERIDRLAENINALAGKLNGKSADINRNVDAFRNRYGEPKPFVQGLYDPNAPSVTIFQFKDAVDLRFVLAHEFGHALGIEEHVGSAASLMHYLMGGQNLERPALTDEDIAAYAAACPPRTFSKRESLVRTLIFTPIEDLNARDIIAIFMEE